MSRLVKEPEHIPSLHKAVIRSVYVFTSARLLVLILVSASSNLEM